MAKVNWDSLRYFRRSEFPHDPDRASPSLVRRLDKTRLASGQPIHIHVCYDPSGHAPKSLHHADGKGRAVDFHFGGNRPHFWAFAMLLSMGFEGIGFYPHWKPRPGWHVDTRVSLPATVWTRDENGKYHYGLDEVLAAILKADERGL